MTYPPLEETEAYEVMGIDKEGKSFCFDVPAGVKKEMVALKAAIAYDVLHQHSIPKNRAKLYCRRLYEFKKYLKTRDRIYLMGGKRSRRKGHNFEREVATQLKQCGFPNAKRQLEYQEDECVGVDIANTSKYKIQCKRHKNYVPVNTIKEVQCDRYDVPIVVTKADGELPMAILPWHDLMSLIRDTELKESDKNNL